MANASIAALRFTRNDVLELISIFERVLGYAGSGFASDCENKNNCLQAIETIIKLGYRAVEQYGLYTKSYQLHLQSYIYHSSICFGKQANNLSKVNAVNPIAAPAQSFVEMLLLAINNFAKLGYPDYYKDFAAALAVVIGGKAVIEAGLSATAAKLAKIFLHVADKLPQDNITEFSVAPAMRYSNG